MAAASRSMLILLALALAGSASPALARSKAAIVLTEHSAPWVKVYTGEPVEIRLRAQAGTGFSWFPTSWQSKVKSLSPLKAGRMLPGGSEVQRFLFRSKKKGTYMVGFSYGQPWKGGTKGAKTRTFTIRVR